MTLRPLLGAFALALAGLSAGPAHALFSDDEARRAILDLRQRLDAQRQQIERQAERHAEELRRASEDQTLLRRSLLDLQAQIEALRAELARLRGQDEQVAREIAELQRRQKDVAQGVEERLRRFEPVKVTVDGREFSVDPAEQREYEAAMGVFRKGDFVTAQNAFFAFVTRYPQSGYRPAALFWLGNAQYANRDYKGAIANFRLLLQQAPDHPRVPETLLSIANSQIELKEIPAARTTLNELVKAHPQSEAAAAARERLAKLR